MAAEQGSEFHALLREQVRNEFTASHQYIAVAVYFDDADLPQLAAHFYAQAVEERNHAMMMIQYLWTTTSRCACPASTTCRATSSTSESR